MSRLQMLNRLLQPTGNGQRRPRQPRPEAPCCARHPKVHMKFIGRLYHAGVNRPCPHWACPVRHCGWVACRTWE